MSIKNNQAQSEFRLTTHTKSRKNKFQSIQTNNENIEIDKETQNKQKWEKTLKKIRFDPPNDEYYDNKQAKPGFDIWRILAQAFAQSKNYNSKLLGLNIRIPQTLVVLGPNNYYYLKYDDQNQGVFRQTELDINLNEFEKIVEEQLDPRYREEDSYLFVQRCPEKFQNEISKSVFNRNAWKQKKSMSSGLKYPSLLQQFIYPKSKTVSVTRFCYKTHNYRGTESSYGYKLTNRIQIHNQESKIGVSRKATLCKDFENSFDVSKVSQNALEDMIPQTKNLVLFLEKFFSIRISEMTVDFIQNYKGQLYLFNVKSILSKSAPKKIKRLIQEKQTKDKLKELSCSVYCKLCGMLFKKDDASKILTQKLLWEFCKHLKKRGKTLPDIDYNHSSTRPCRVCDLCYMAVVSEHELVELEQKFALLQNIPIKDLFLKVPVEKNPKNRPALLKETLKQWRLMLYIKEIQFDSNQFDTIESLQQEFHLQIKLASINSSFKLKLPQITKGQKYISFPLKILRMYYFFSESLEISDFLLNSELDIIFSRKTQARDVLCHGSSKTIQKFKNNLKKGQKHESNVYLFFNNSEIAALKLVVGLVGDGECNTKNMNLYKFYNIYFPDEDFYNCNILPIEWIEIFHEEKENKNKENESNENLEIEEAKKMIGFENYTPFCSNIELKKMLNDPFVSKTETNKKAILKKIKEASVTTRPTTTKKPLQRIYTKPKRLNSAFPQLQQYQRQGTAFQIKNQKKVCSSHNPKNFQQIQINKQFLERLEEENDLYKDYINNLDKLIFSSKKEKNQENIENYEREKDLDELKLIIKYNESNLEKQQIIFYKHFIFLIIDEYRVIRRKIFRSNSLLKCLLKNLKDFTIRICSLTCQKKHQKK